MADSFNPYAPPEADLDAPHEAGGVWRDGGLVHVAEEFLRAFLGVERDGERVARRHQSGDEVARGRFRRARVTPLVGAGGERGQGDAVGAAAEGFQVLDLVVVTASSNAAADGTPGLDGLPRLSSAFLGAGGRSLMLSQWVVNGDSTLKLVSRMLRERSRGLGNAEALRRAMLALMNGEDRAAYTHPMYWAPFVVVGEGAATARPVTATGAATPRQ